MNNLLRKIRKYFLDTIEPSTAAGHTLAFNAGGRRVSHGRSWYLPAPSARREMRAWRLARKQKTSSRVAR